MVSLRDGTSSACYGYKYSIPRKNTETEAEKITVQARGRGRGKSAKGDGNKERESEIADLVDTVYTPWSGQRSNGGARGEDGESGEDAGCARAGQVACAPAPYKGRGAGTRAREPADPPAIYAGAPRLFDASSTTEIRTVPETYTRAHTRRQRRAPAQRPRPPEDPPVLGPRTCVRGRSGATARGGGGGGRVWVRAS